MGYKKPTLDKFLATLLDDVLTSNTFIDWERVKNFLEDYRREIGLLGSLSKKEPLKDLEDLLLHYPRILELLHHLIAHEPMRLNLLDIGNVDFKKDMKRLKSGNTSTAKRLAEAFDKMGLIEEIINMKSVFDFSKGVMVGLEPNKRKYRRGSIFQDKLLPELIEKIITALKGEKKICLRGEGGVGMKILVGGREKYPDFGIFFEEKLIAFIEVNFYTTSGSKPKI